jgi:hypothetical protein
MIDRIRTLVIAVVTLPLCVPVGACSDGPDAPSATGRMNRIVCMDGGRVFLDDFAKRNTSMDGGGILFTSVTTGERSRVVGNCVAYMDSMPAGWKATLPHPDPDATTITSVDTLDDGTTITRKEILP